MVDAQAPAISKHPQSYTQQPPRSNTYKTSANENIYAIHKTFSKNAVYVKNVISCLFKIRKIAVCFLWLSLPGHYRITDEALLAETT